ncbi:lipopolysaccharide assembly protein LapB [Neptunomonas sp.]|uniref:lipopolysaccharide assembly protein LapB n=1 Tax=Neptunomonas TaxID=75687 RepID=UPI0035159A57
MLDYRFILLLMLAIAIGWFLGRWSKQKQRYRPASQETGLNRDYFQGLNFLLSDQPNEAIESFIRTLEINSDTLPAHLALARLFRKKGDVERAIKMHQNLLARPDLSREDQLRVHMALALDYDSIGLLDRSEHLLVDVLKEPLPDATRIRALTKLIKLYEKEQEWDSALQATQRLGKDQNEVIKKSAAHYACELAEQSYQQHNTKQAMAHLKTALSYDANCVRASLMMAEIFSSQQQWKMAISRLRQIETQDRYFVSEALPYLKSCYQSLNKLSDYEQYLRDCLSHTPSASIILALTELVFMQQGAIAAGLFLTQELKHRPSIKGFNRLIDLHLEYGSASAKESLQTLKSLTSALEESKPQYQCYQCGYAAKQLAWHCPSCKNWSSIRPIQGLEGE